MTMQLLLIENKELHQSQSLLSNLENQGYQVIVVDTIETAAIQTDSLWPNLIIFRSPYHPLDPSHLQEFISRLTVKIPCIIVSEEDYLPLETASGVTMVSISHPQQLVKNIQEAVSNQKERFIRLANLVIDRQQRQVLRNNERYSLTPKEFKLLQLLIDNHNQVLSRKEIMQAVWETDYMGDTRTLDVHIRWIREKIEDNPSKPQRLITVRGRGYRFIMNLD